MENIRKAAERDVSRIAEILVFNNRVNFYPIFKEDEYSFGELQVVDIAAEFLTDRKMLDNTYIYDDGVVRGLIILDGREVKKLFVDTFFQNRGIGEKLLNYAVENHGVDHLWALEKNTGAIRFYKKHGFSVTEEKVFEEGTTEYLVKLIR